MRYGWFVTRSDQIRLEGTYEIMTVMIETILLIHLPSERAGASTRGIMMMWILLLLFDLEQSNGNGLVFS